MIRRRVVITGRVQGVFFRDSLRRLAREKGISGWVLNRADGAVEAVLEGPQEAVEEAIAFCRQGPPRARVEAVRSSEEPLEGLSGFEVR
jgi:acylphosphatase